MEELSNAYVNGIPLVLVVIGLVTLIGKLGVTGKAQLATSLVVGMLLGIAYQISLAMPQDFAGWFGAAIYGLALGLVASGIYEAGKSAVAKALDSPYDPPK